MRNPLTSVRIILLNTFHPGNIGAAARAMKTMGLSELVLVNPRCFPDDEATSRAAGAANVLTGSKVVTSFEQAIADCTQVFATSARKEHEFSRPQLSCEQAASWIKKHPSEKIAIVFGGERDGMSAYEISLCQQLLYIPGNPDYSVLNMSAAVQIVCYELFRQLAADSSDVAERPANKLVSQSELNHFYEHLQQLLAKSGYIRAEQPTATLKKLRTFLNRAQPTSQEIGLLRGMIKALGREDQKDKP